jgi:hypothetical protein
VSKFAETLTKFSKMRELTLWEENNLHRMRMTIGVVSKQWGERTDFGRGDNRPFFGSGAGLVMKTTSFSERIFGELNATRAALTTIRQVLTSSWRNWGKPRPTTHGGG